MLGAATATTFTQTIASGAVSSGAAGYAEGFIRGLGNQIFFGNGDPIRESTQGAGFGFVTGGLVSGIGYKIAHSTPNNILTNKSSTTSSKKAVDADIVNASVKTGRNSARFPDGKVYIQLEDGRWLPYNPNSTIRSSQFFEHWEYANLNATINRFAPGSTGVITPKGKVIYNNSTTGIQIVHDPAGNYFRIQDTNLTGRRAYLDLNGNIPNNKVVNGKIMGRSQVEYNRITHFKSNY